MNHWKRYAFISYSHQDTKMAKRLHKKLESYKLPTEIHNEFEDSKYLRPVFRDQDDLDSGVLGDELRKHLESSKYLIVICSPRSAKSEWVSNEVKTFIEWGRVEYIIPFVIDGTPNSGDENECFPKSLLEYVEVHPDRELLGINIAEVGREKAFVRVVSRMLDVTFDELWKRHERERKRRILFTTISTPIVLSLLYYFAIPISLTIEIHDDKHHLPLPEDAVLMVNDAEYSMDRLDTTLTIYNLPGYYRGRTLPIKLLAKWYKPVKENISIGWGIKFFLIKTLQRDETFSEFSGRVIDENGCPVVGATLYMENQESLTDNDGCFSFVFPVDEQSEIKEIRIVKDGFIDFVREDESPGTDIIFVLRKQ